MLSTGFTTFRYRDAPFRSTSIPPSARLCSRPVTDPIKGPSAGLIKVDLQHQRLLVGRCCEQGLAVAVGPLPSSVTTDASCRRVPSSRPARQDGLPSVCLTNSSRTPTAIPHLHS